MRALGSRSPPFVVIVAATIAAAAAGALIPLFAPAYYAQLAVKTMTLGLAAMSLNLLVGGAGLVSLCHAAFYGIAGYVLAWLSPPDTAPALLPTLLAALAASSAAAAVIGALALRARGIYFIMTTLAFGEMVFFLFHDTSIAGGSDGIVIDRAPRLRIADTVVIDLAVPETMFYVVLCLTVAALLLQQGLMRSAFGRALGAARESEVRARALGFAVNRLHLAAFVLSGAEAGLAGYFATAQYGFVAPQMAGWHLSALFLVAVVLGGTGRLEGPLIGAAVIVLLEESLRALTDHWRLALGLMVMALVFLAPGGVRALTGGPRPPRAGERRHGGA